MSQLSKDEIIKAAKKKYIPGERYSLDQWRKFQTVRNAADKGDLKLAAVYLEKTK